MSELLVEYGMGEVKINVSSRKKQHMRMEIHEENVEQGGVGGSDGEGTRLTVGMGSSRRAFLRR